MSDERRIMILYGSQTGTAQDVAERIERDAIRRHLVVTGKPLDRYDIVSVPQKLSVGHIVSASHCCNFVVHVLVSIEVGDICIYTALHA